MSVGWADMVVVGAIARPHGLRGQVIVQPETEFPDERFKAGSTMFVEGPSAAAGPRRVTVREARWHSGRLLVSFDGCERLEDVEALGRGQLRVLPEQVLPLPPGRFYHHQLVGCEVVTTGGDRVGTVTAVDDAGATRLVVRGQHGEVLVPLAADICVDVDVGTQRIVVALPEGLLDVNA